MSNLAKQVHACCSSVRNMVPVDHPANIVERDTAVSRISYNVYVCCECGTYHGCRYKWSRRSGKSFNWESFGPTPQSVKRNKRNG